MNTRAFFLTAMAALEAAIQKCGAVALDGRVWPGHDEFGWEMRSNPTRPNHV